MKIVTENIDLSNIEDVKELRISRARCTCRGKVEDDATNRKFVIVKMLAKSGSSKINLIWFFR